jgi:hypothetical protein
LEKRPLFIPSYNPEQEQEKEFDPDADVTKMSLPQQLAWNKKKIQFLAE